MQETMLKRARQVASEAAVAAGTLVRERFDSAFVVLEKGADGDLVTEVDEMAEADILRRLQVAFPGPSHPQQGDRVVWRGGRVDVDG